MDSSEILAQSIDKSQVPPLHQKRILAFVNHFLISSCSFLNEFGLKCETKFIELERKMQKVEAALTIIEAKLASIPDTETSSSKEAVSITTPSTSAELPAKSEQNEEASTQSPTVEVDAVAPLDPPSGVRACDDVRYKKFFKMIQFGVPAGAVKIKMQAEGGVDPHILDTPNLILPDGITS